MTAEESFPKAKAFAAAFESIDWKSRESVDAAVAALSEALEEAALEDKASADRIMQIQSKL